MDPFIGGLNEFPTYEELEDGSYFWKDIGGSFGRYLANI
jgi:hypothetical protein